MKCALHGLAATAAAALIFCGGSVLAQSAAQVSLDKCQKTVAKEAGKYVKLRVKAVASCLQKISGELVKKNSGGVQPAAAACVAQLRKTNDTRGLGRSLEERMRAKIERSCDPATNPHALADILGTGAGVPESLQVENLDQWCSHFGGDGAIDSLDEWIDCMVAAHGCEADQAISVQYARVLEWLAMVKAEMETLSAPGGDASRVDDAVAAIDAFVLLFDPNGDGVLEVACGPAIDPQLATCQNDRADCQADLAQALDDLSACNANLASCQDDLGVCDANLTSCQDDLGTCNSDLATCQDDVLQAQSDLAQAEDDLSACQDELTDCHGLPATGQTTSYGSGSDGDVQAGHARSFTDNGDGTITDHVTGLMWEKKDDFNDSAVNCSNETGSCGNPHDADNRYTWTAAGSSFNGTLVSIFLEQLNHRCNADPSVNCKAAGDAACELALGVGERCGFASYRNWRIANVTELLSLNNYEVAGFSPTSFPAFHTGCSPSCDLTDANTCSCTAITAAYWTSTTEQIFAGDAWIVSTIGDSFWISKTNFRSARAVRNGS